MPDDRQTFNEFLQDIQQVFPDASPNYIRRLVNKKAEDLSLKYNLMRKETTFDVVSGQANYDLLALGAVKVTRVDFSDNDGKYVLIPQLIDGEFRRKSDRD